MSLFYNDTVYVLRPGTRQNRAGEDILDYAGLRALLEVTPYLGEPRSGVHVRPTASDGRSEIIREDRDAVANEWRIATPAGSPDWDIRSIDWVRLPSGQIASVFGDPSRPSNPFGGGLHHVQVLVREVR